MELKPPMSYEAQVNRLIEHGMVVDDKDKAIDILARVNYYRLTGYAFQFRTNPGDSTYVEGTSFDTVYNLYMVDEKLRDLFRMYIEKQKDALDRLMAYRSRFLQVYEYQKQEDDKKAALHAKLIVSDVKKSLVSSANLSYHGMQGNVEMGFLIESHDKAKQIEEVMKEMVRMKVFVRTN